MCMYAHAFMYFIGLVSGEACMLAAGFGYHQEEWVGVSYENVPKQIEESYDKFETMRLIKFLFATDISGITNNWNV